MIILLINMLIMILMMIIVVIVSSFKTDNHTNKQHITGRVANSRDKHFPVSHHIADHDPENLEQIALR